LFVERRQTGPASLNSAYPLAVLNRAKVDAIPADASAGRAPRNHIVSLKRLSDDLETMEEVVALVEQRRLVLQRLPLEQITPDLNAYHNHWLEHWARCKVMGRQSMELLPYAMWWFQQHRQQCGLPHQTEIWSKKYTHRVHLGKPRLAWMVNLFERRRNLRRQCLIPHIKKGEPNELLVFERGESWARVERPAAR
jgi:hypothetical protein